MGGLSRRTPQTSCSARSGTTLAAIWSPGTFSEGGTTVFLATTPGESSAAFPPYQACPDAHQRFQQINAKQFASLKDGDRFFFTHSSEAGSLTKGQLQEIRPRRLGDIICDNTGISSVRENVLLVASSSNPLRSCSEARSIQVREFV